MFKDVMVTFSKTNIAPGWGPSQKSSNKETHLPTLVFQVRNVRESQGLP